MILNLTATFKQEPDYTIQRFIELLQPQGIIIDLEATDN